MSLTETVFRAARNAGVSRPGVERARLTFALLTLGLSGAITVTFAASITEWTALAALAVVLVAVTSAWISGGAATALIGLLREDRKGAILPAARMPKGRTALLVTLCGEAPEPVAAYLGDLRDNLARLGLDETIEIFVLSDTPDDGRATREEAAFAALAASHTVTYRRRRDNSGRKPGNILEWLERRGDAFDYMLVLDADSRMSAERIGHMIRQIEARPRTGLLQAGMTLIPGRSRFGRHQRTSVRLLSSNFGRGMAAWAGRSCNYWGHNAIIRVEAFRRAAKLPCLPGRAPFGGPILSHDFIEAAYIRRAGWAVELEPDLAGSAEDGPQSLSEFHKRDRRWCQGNLQHIRLLGEPGLHPMSRVHLLAGIVSYLAAPIWLMLVLLIASGAAPVTGALPFALIALVLLLPKLCALAGRLGRARTVRRRAITLRAWLGELVVSTLIAPVIMVHQTGSVISVLMGRDCGWKSGRKARLTLPTGLPEALVGAALLWLGAQSETGATLWLAPLIAPLLAAPVLVRALDAEPA
jgi:membrane glycosyltransferase